MLEKQYELVANAPSPIDIDIYFKVEKEKYLSLLDSELLEKDYQKFFESNPAFMPGAFELTGGVSSHYPVMNALISQPILGDEKIRKPDFMWLAKDSLCFCPVLIEIEKPSKQEFRNDEVARACFTQAVGQIKQGYFLSAYFNLPFQHSLFLLSSLIPRSADTRIYTSRYTRFSLFPSEKAK